jgi:hypothetical protein
MKSLLLLIITAAAPAFAGTPNTLTPAEAADGFTLIFDGKTLDGFRNFKKEDINPKWVINDGALTLTEKGGGHLITKREYKNFEFRFEFKIAAEGNSGVLWHSVETGKSPHETGPEYQILDSFSKTAYQSELGKGNISGALYDLIPGKPADSKPAGEWNEGSIRIQGTQIKLTLNGRTTAEVDTNSDRWKELIAKSKFAKQPKYNSAAEGHLVFQDHGNPVAFRTLRIKEL